jgi:hypothetical protein
MKIRDIRNRNKNENIKISINKISRIIKDYKKHINNKINEFKRIQKRNWMTEDYIDSIVLFYESLREDTNNEIINVIDSTLEIDSDLYEDLTYELDEERDKLQKILDIY